MPALQRRYFLLTIPRSTWDPPQSLDADIQYLKGQEERGGEGYAHWQVMVVFKKPITVTKVKTHFNRETHVEPTRSAAANQYVWKDDTAVPGTRFELGELKFKRNCKEDWNKVREQACAGDLHVIPGDIFIRCYSNLRKIKSDYQRPIIRPVQVVNVFWGISGSGKTKRVFEEAGDEYYIKMSSTKWFDGYQGQQHIIVDEFTGQVAVEHLLKWLDRYPCSVEIKGSQVYLNTTTWWFTSNINPKDWYPNIPEEQYNALRRRFTNVVHFNKPFNSYF
jgi:hypothetical protein